MITRWEPGFGFGNIWRLQDEVNRLFEGRLGASSRFPAMNVWTSKDDVAVELEIPGVEPKDVEITVTGASLAISGQRQPEAVKENEVYHRRERQYGAFSRSLELPYAVDADKVEAVFCNGVLRVVLPRSEADKPRKIAVKAE